MNTPPPSSDDDEEARFERQAADWLIRRDEGWTEDDAAAYDAWRAADPRHQAAAERMELAHRFLSRLPHVPASHPLWQQAEAAATPAAPVVRFPRWVRSVAAAAAVVALGLGAWSIHSHVTGFSNVYQTEQVVETLALPDGSQVRLSAVSQLEVEYNRRERLLRLPRGEAFFQVAHETDRPFHVTAGGLNIRAVGTAFRVHHRPPNTIEVVVTEGRVRVAPLSQAGLAGAGAQTVTMAAGERLVWDPALPLREQPIVPAAEVLVSNPETPEVPWLKFRNTPLIEAIDAFNRHSRVKLEVGDPSLAERGVEGTFRADEAESFARLLAEGGQIQLEHISSDRIILRPVR